MAVRVVTILLLVLTLSSAFQYKGETCAVEDTGVKACKGPPGSGCTCTASTLKCSDSCSTRVKLNLFTEIKENKPQLKSVARYKTEDCDDSMASMKCQSGCECKCQLSRCKCQGTTCPTKEEAKAAEEKKKAAEEKKKALAALKKRKITKKKKTKKPSFNWRSKWRNFKKRGWGSRAHGGYYGDELYEENANGYLYTDMSYDNGGFITQFLMVLIGVMIFGVCCVFCIVLNIIIAYVGWLLGKVFAKNSNSNYKLLQRNVTDVEENQDELVV